MTSDYAKIREDNVRRYGTEIGRIGKMLLADRYDKRTHFIYELLQNAEDALRRRVEWTGSRTVKFYLEAGHLAVSHYGEPFTERDVIGVSGIDESTKTATSIGRFGIGFKSVYAYTDRPEVHSGDEGFAIENYVWPIAASSIGMESAATTFLFPFRPNMPEAHSEILVGLQQLGARALLFLREIAAIEWQSVDEASGLYLRTDPVSLDSFVRRVTVLGELRASRAIEEDWLVFSRDMSHEGVKVSPVEIAFFIAHDSNKRDVIRRLDESPLVVFFPTVVETHLGFLIQGPYQTTPSRDNVPTDLSWNKAVISETAILLRDALRWLRANELLTVDVLESLPLDQTRYVGHLVEPLFDVVKLVLSTEEMLPAYGGGYVAASHARLARTQELRDLLTPEQVGALLGKPHPVKWLAADVTADRRPQLRNYLLYQLQVGDFTPETLVLRLTKEFLESQDDEWLVRLYEFLSAQPALQRRLTGLPLVRLEDGSHVVPMLEGVPQAFFPSDIETDFPTVRVALLRSPTTRMFLGSMGLTEPDPVDDIVRHVVPRFSAGGLSYSEYDILLRRILHAFGTDSKQRREALVTKLVTTPFVVAVDAATQSKTLVTPGNVYLATERLQALFSGVPGVLIVDSTFECLRGEGVRDLLEACGAARHLAPIRAPGRRAPAELAEMRREAGCLSYSREESLVDHEVRGLAQLLELMATLDPAERVARARLLWDALRDLRDRRQAAFSGRYGWFFLRSWSADFDASFVRRLRNSSWVPTATGHLHQPSEILFESTGWTSDPFLLSKIQFKKPVIEELAREAGIDAAVLDFLMSQGLTSLHELQSRLLPDERSNESDLPTRGGEEDAESPSVQPVPVPSSQSEGGGGTVGRSPEQPPRGGEQSGHAGSSHSSARTSQPRRFVSYVAVESGTEDNDPDGLDLQARMNLEAVAIARILKKENGLQTTPPGNEGFDLLELDASGEPERWIEVKAMSGSLEDRPVGMSKPQFDFARRHGDQFWLYVVEFAADDHRARIVKIRDPAGRAGTFTFDHGWVAEAEVV